MSWKRVQRTGAIEKWTQGRTAVGVLREVRDGQFGPLLDLMDANGKRITFGVPTILKSILDDVPVGTEIRITCKGKVQLRNGQEAWDFEVEERADAPVIPENHATESDEHIPF